MKSIKIATFVIAAILVQSVACERSQAQEGRASQPLTPLPELKERFKQALQSWHQEVSPQERAISECATNDSQVRAERMRMFREVPRYLGSAASTNAEIRNGDGYLHFLRLNAKVMTLGLPLGATGDGLRGLAAGVHGRVAELQQAAETTSQLKEQLRARTQFLREKLPLFEIRPEQQQLPCDQRAFVAFYKAKDLNEKMDWYISLVKAHADQLRKRWERIGTILEDQVAGRKSALNPPGPGGTCENGQFPVPELGMCQVNEVKPRPRF